ncbi:baseplate J-like protein [Leptospira interrogans str. 2003000735]|uniref:Baseplate J-like protein n=2 Tax=Leptospira interrogans TaxID=173 RepID=A0A829DBJ0_LEPIR|nr:baseplate J/gp47 family protein [Leptospira interrogans]EMY06258.1 baseplate J-like protein [Leptospira interrogans str. 2002000626]EMY25579.1 baseplate J-like protein [Leptospira interrogans serovar Australis str. 200703203]EKN89819.1 baseplate J-like protein [Leptospira interrogans str. 2002000624]EKQ40255.1 baseplate J-like protein [Leptospira interrogans str. 2002000621]EKQ46159.1 baseplate J-like protein [Leptospira interrogans str. 2002000623]
MNLSVTKDQVLADHLQSIKAFGVFKNHSFSPTSKTFTLIRALSNAVFSFIDTDLISIQKAIHPHTAEDDALHEHLIRRGMKWKPALPSIIKVRIGSSTQPIIDREIPQSLVVTTVGNEDQKIRFFLKDSLTLPAGISADAQGKFTIEAFVQCMIDGPAGNVVPGSISIIESPPEGIDYIKNLESDPIQQGQYRETRTSVRSRLQTAEGVSSMWTPAWYISEAESFAFVKRAIFKSAKALGKDGEVKILLQGSVGSLTSAQLNQVQDHFNSEENDPGGVAHLGAENINEAVINKTVTVKFSSADQIPSQSVLDQIKDEYFLSLSEGQDFVDAQLKALYQALPSCIDVEFNPLGNVDVPDGALASPGSGFQVVGTVYV